MTSTIAAVPQTTSNESPEGQIRRGRVHVFGPPGSGKSTFAAALARSLGVEHIDLDSIATSKGVTSDLQPLLPWKNRLDFVHGIGRRTDGWVTEGTYLGWTDPLFQAADLVVWLDIPRHSALSRAARRHLKQRCSTADGAYSLPKSARFARHPGAKQFVTFARHIGRYYSEGAGDGSHRSEQYGRAIAAETVRPLSHKLLHVKEGPGAKDVARAADRAVRSVAKESGKSEAPAAYSRYARLHQTSDTPVHYDGAIYAPSGFDQHVWEIQKRILAHELDRPGWLTRAKYLDFATGTGRILAHFHEQVAHATAVDTSAQMLDAARTKAPEARLFCVDILEEDPLAGESFDLVTAFRFFLNTEPELRQPILNRLVGLLKDNDSVLIFNIHANRRSVLGMLEPLRRLKGWPRLNLMSEREVRRLCEDAGLEIVSSRGVALFPPRLVRSRLGSVCRRIDRFASERQLLKGFSQDLLFVCRKTAPSQTG